MTIDISSVVVLSVKYWLKSGCKNTRLPVCFFAVCHLRDDIQNTSYTVALDSQRTKIADLLASIYELQTIQLRGVGNCCP